MALKYLVIFFAIYCISEGTETVPQITYKLEDYELNQWGLLPLNAMYTQPELNEDTFLVLEGQRVTISVYYNTSTSSGLKYVMCGRTLSKNVNTKYFKCVEGHCSAELQIDSIYNEMKREWQFWFHKNEWNFLMKNVRFHIRPSITVSYNSVEHNRRGNKRTEGAVQQTVTPYTFPVFVHDVSYMYVNVTSMHTQVAANGIKDFDAFACFVYNGNILINLTCHYTGGLPLREISFITDGLSYPGSTRTENSYYTAKISPEEDGTYLDCIPRYLYFNKHNVQYTEDFTILRIFLVHSETGSIGNKHLEYAQIKPVSNEDNENCLKYVNCLYDPETEDYSNVCTQTTSNLSGNASTTKTTSIIVTVVVLLLVALALLIIYIYYKRNKNARDFFVNYTPRSVPNDYVTTQMSSVPRNNREPAALQSTPETEVNEHCDDEDVMLENPIYCTLEEIRDIAESNYAVIVGVIKNGKQVDFKNP